MDLEDAAAFAKKLAGATNRTCKDYYVGDVLHEEAFSDQLCGRLKETLEDFETGEIKWQADVAIGRGRFSARSLTKTKEEPEFGADLVMTLDVKTPRESVRKGYLTQAKRLEPRYWLSTSEHDRLLVQCERMVAITSASLVFLYHREGVRVIRADAVLARHDRNLWSISHMSIEQLYQDFAICTFGDHDIRATDPGSLETLRRTVAARAAVRITGRSAPNAFKP